MSGVRPGVWLAVGVVFAALFIGTVVRLATLRAIDAHQRRARIGSLITWWTLAVLLAASVLLGRTAATLLFAGASLLGLREMLALSGEPRRDRVAELLAYVATLLQYLWISLDWHYTAALFIPVAVFLALPVRILLTGRTVGFLHDVSSLFWSLMLVTYCLSHAPLLLTLSPATNPIGEVAGWFLYLIILTETNDIAQALWGRQLGRHKVTPRVSPNKTWEGLVLGMTTTILVAAGVAPLLTPLAAAHPPRIAEASWLGRLPYFWALLAGLLIAVGGFFGDITMSALKRDAGVKDSGTLLPGQGGVLDRIDSLSFTAPLFYYYVRLLYVV